MEEAVAQEERAESAAEQRRASKGSPTASGSTSPTDHGPLKGVEFRKLSTKFYIVYVDDV